MELAFDDRQLLLPGVYEVSMETVKEHFGKFQRSDRRMKLFAKLTEYLDAVKRQTRGLRRKRSPRRQLRDGLRG